MSKITSPKQKLNSIVVNGAPLEWGQDGAGFSFYGVDSVLFWIKPSLVSMLQPLLEELGEDLYSRLIAFEATKGTFEDYSWMVSEGKKFEDGFNVWGQAVSACGWGTFNIREIDWDKKTATVIVGNPWEMKILEFVDEKNHIPFLVGKMSGVFTAAFGTNCRAEVASVKRLASGTGIIQLRVQASHKTLEQALVELHEQTKSSDNTRFQALNNALRRNERRFLDVIETVGDFIWESDSSLRITYSTNRGSNLLGLPEGDLIGKTWQELMPALEVKRLRIMLNSLGPSKSFAEDEFYLHNLAGERRWIRLSIKRLLDFNSNHSGYVGSGRDVTEKVNLQAKLLEQQKNSEFSAKMATLGEMAGGVAHEINTPLAVISLTSEALAERFEEGSQNRRQIEIILQTTERIAKIIHGLRTFARDASQDPLVQTPLSSIVEDSLSLCRLRFQSSGVVLKIGAIPESVMVECRSTQISQVLLNLLNNAFDAVCELEDKWISLEFEAASEKLRIRITDSGLGIPEAVREKMMRPFFTTKPIGKGTGIGLSISTGIVESHSGRLYYDESCPTTCFVVELPLN